MENTIQEVKFRLYFTKQADVQVTLKNRVREKHMVMLPTTVTHRGPRVCRCAGCPVPLGVGVRPRQAQSSWLLPQGDRGNGRKATHTCGGRLRGAGRRDCRPALGHPPFPTTLL